MRLVFARLSECRKTIDNIKSDIIEKMNTASAKKGRDVGFEALRKSMLEQRENLESELKNHGMNSIIPKMRLMSAKKKSAKREKAFRICAVCGECAKREKKELKKNFEYKKEL